MERINDGFVGILDHVPVCWCCVFPVAFAMFLWDFGGFGA